jgi:hypothetical protein
LTKVTGQHLLESPLSADQQVRQDGDWLRISATVIETEQLKWWLRSFGDAVSVLRPVSVARSL